ncbi:MAG: cell wall metabolism sensor histidine kinase WalK [Methylacidiphilales bacterium]|nr:cell wall metabolism sensor histidine kinase WalK [Candidatus Methylacidiphilales bacterium]
MTLNRRLLLGIAPVLLILLAVGIYAIFLFSKLGGAIDVILRENYRSVVASQNMKEAAARMDSGLLFTLGGEEERGKQLFQDNVPVFERNSDVESHNITLPGEGDLENRVKALHAKYMDAATKFFALSPTDPARRALYFNQLLPTFTAVQQTAGQILEINQQNMLEANNEARRQSRAASRYMIGTLLTGFIVATGVTYALARSIVQSLQSLTESAQQLGEGNLDQHVPVQSQDEVGKLAEAFNKMAAKLRAYRQSTTDKILQAQQTTESALRAFPDPILVFSPNKEIQLQNAAAEHFLRQIGGNIASLEALSSAIDQSLKGSADFQPTSFDKAISVSIEGAEKFFLPRVLAMRNEAGNPVGVVVALQDVTRFRVADDVKTDLIATVSHELKTPLTSIQLAIYLLLDEKVGSLTPKQTGLLLAARTNSDRLFEMVEDLLDLARFEGGAALIEKKAIACQQLVQEVADREKELVVSRGLELKVKTEPLLPRVEVSRARIDLVFANFISNAAKHSPSGGVITLSARRDGAKNVRFTVHDEGPGVPKELRRRIFDKFFRVAESSDEGAGLGLSIAREIVLAHGGSIGVAGEEKKGSEFFFTLPALV